MNPGFWTGNLLLNSTTSLPFKVELYKKKEIYILIIYNGSEKIILNTIYKENDSLHLNFPSFSSKLVLKVNNKKKLTGYWLNRNKESNYKIPCTLTYGYSKRFKQSQLNTKKTTPSNYQGKWEGDFNQNTSNSYKALAVFDQKTNDIQGTFLTETGDYRFLDGNVYGDSMYLSCFDGSHAFLFTGTQSNGQITGEFFSGKHYQTTWAAIRNDSFKLKDPDSLTYVINKDSLKFNFKNLNGTDFQFPNDSYKNKIVIIQIMGSWCPNCLDETRYYKDLYQKYNSQGLEIISIGYEIGNTFQEYVEKINSLKNRLDLNYTFLVGGPANKNLASEHFKILNQIISFPTSIFIGKDGEIKRVHTGFSGPATGQYYLDYINETDLFIQSLIND